MSEIVNALREEARFRPTIWGDARPLLVAAAAEIERKHKALETVLRTMTEDDYTPEGGRTLTAIVREAIAPATCKESLQVGPDPREEIERLNEIIVEEHPDRWRFETLMYAADRILAEKYPADIFTGESGDPGPRLVAALRDCRAALSDPERTSPQRKERSDE